MASITGLYQCPSCCSPLSFRSRETRLIVCRHCGKSILRPENDELSVADIDTIADNTDLIQPGSKGSFEGRNFEVLGRFRCWLGEAVVNYWTLLPEGNGCCLLQESYGLYAILNATTLDKPIGIADLTKPGTDVSITLHEEEYFLLRRDYCVRYEIQGEVYMPGSRGSFPVFDLQAYPDKCLTLMENLNDTMNAWDCRYTSFSALHLSGLNPTPPKPLDIECSKCHSKFQVKTFPYALSSSCHKCGSRLVFKHKHQEFRSYGDDRSNKNEMAIPLGAKGSVKGIDYEVIGYALKEENSHEAYRWSEYVLYNREEGYAFLSEYLGSWIYTREVGIAPVLRDDPFAFDSDGIEYTQYNKYQIRIVDTAGEFPYNIFDDTMAVAAEFIAPPHMWIYERANNEGIGWFFGEHLDRKQLHAQFPYDLPKKKTRGILEPGGFRDTTPAALRNVTLLGLGLLILVHILTTSNKEKRIITNETIHFPDSLSSVNYATPAFHLDKWRSNLEFIIEAPVKNDWMEVEGSLIDNKTGDEYSFDEVVEQYEGYDDGEFWSEGRNYEKAYLSSIPSGDYVLQIHGTKDASSSNAWLTSLNIEAINDVSDDRNLFIFIGILLIYPIIAYIRIYIAKRKSSS